MKDRPVLAHFHEWMGGVAVPRIAHLQLPVATIFTTHATLLGRYLASDNIRVHIDVDRDGRVSRGDYITMESYPVLTWGHPDRVTVRVREVK